MYDTDRKTASKLLKVSMRTVDRYIVGKKLSTEQRDGRIWLDKKEILKLRARKTVGTSGAAPTSKMSIDKSVSSPVDMSIDGVDFVSTADLTKKPHGRHNTEEQVYKKLFEELRADLKEKQERLEGANYRVGQLEALLKDTVPRLDYQRALNEEKALNEELHTHLETEQLKAEELLYSLKEQKTDKRIYIVILFIIMLLQPLWLILSLQR